MQSGEVKVNGKIILHPGQPVIASVDEVGRFPLCSEATKRLNHFLEEGVSNCLISIQGDKDRAVALAAS